MAMAADWSELPKDLLNLISERIDSELDLTRFRSVCSNWRSSSIPNHHPNSTIEFPLFKAPFLSDSINNITSFCKLFKHSFFLIKPPLQQQQQTLVQPWLIRITQTSSDKNRLIHPFLTHQYQSPYPFHFPHALNFSELSVRHLGSGFINAEPEPLKHFYMQPEKVVSVTCQGKKPIVLATLHSIFTPVPLLLKCGDDNWKVIPDILTFSLDVCLFKGWPYVVDKVGQTITFGPDDLTVQLVAEPFVDGAGGKVKFLVENEGDLLLVDIYEIFLSYYLDEDALRIYVYRLDEKEKKWVSLTSLGDRVLFLGNGCSFSASASDLCVAKGNCIIFIDYMKNGNCVFHLDQDRLSPLSDYPEYFNLFWPPPEWIIKSCISS